jgi:hypothetical protein
VNTLPNPTDQEPNQKEGKEHSRSGGVSPTIIRDIALIIALLFLGKLALWIYVKFLPPGGVFSQITLSFYFGVLIAGFAFIGCLARGNRWFHLLYVTLGVWLIAAFLCGLAHDSWSIWFAAILLPVTMLLGGALSYAFRKEDRKPLA